jgi:hypothetical protein
MRSVRCSSWLAFLAGAILFCASSAAVTYKAGVAVEDITPCPHGITNEYTAGIFVDRNDRGLEVGLLNGTGGGTRPMEHIESPLTARALALGDSDGNTFVILTLDICILDASITKDIRAKILQTRNLAPWQVLINISHTHSSPATTWLIGLVPLGESAPVTAYIEAMKLRAVSAISRALEGMQPATIRFATGSTSVATWRRYTDPTGGAYDTAVPQRVDALTIDSAEAVPRAIATTFIFRCHTTSMYNTALTSADYPDQARRTIEASRPGSTALFVQGFGGDMEPVLNECPTPPPNNGDCLNGPGLTSKTQTGFQLGSDVLALLSSARALSGPIHSKSLMIQLPLSPPAFPNRINFGQQTLPTELQLLQIGDDATADTSWSLAASSHEVVHEWIDPVRKALERHKNLSLAGYANAVSSYLPTRRMIVHDRDDPGFLYNHRYEGCGAFLYSYHLGAPAWFDYEFLTGFRDLDDLPFPAPLAPGQWISAYGPVSQDLLDDFNDASVDSKKWSQFAMTAANPGGAATAGALVYDGNVRVRERNGRLEILPISDTGLHYNGVVAANAINLTGRGAQVEIKSIPNGAAEMLFSLGPNGYNYYRFLISAGRIFAQEGLARELAAGFPKQDEPVSWTIDVTQSPGVAFDANAHRFLRIAHNAASDAMAWFTSADGVTWKPFFTLPRRFPIQSTRPELIAGTYTLVPPPGVAAFDNFQLDVAAPVAFPKQTAVNGQTFSMQFAVPQGYTYQIDAAQAVPSSSWQTVLGPVLSDGQNADFSDADFSTFGSRFFRLQLVK